MTAEFYRCPFCCADVPAQATTCSHCTRELTAVRPLALQLQSLEAVVTTVRADLALLQRRANGLERHGYDNPSDVGRSPPSLPRAWSAWLGISLLSIALLGLSHWVLLFVYDARPVVLRALTIVLPMFTGYLCARLSGLRLTVQWFSAVLVGLLSVLLMLGITAHIDGVPFWPANSHEWRETLEYTAAIVLGSFTGALIDQMLLRLTQRQVQQDRLDMLLARNDSGQLRITSLTEQLQSLVSATAPLVSAGTALYSGLKVFIGD